MLRFNTDNVFLIFTEEFGQDAQYTLDVVQKKKIIGKSSTDKTFRSGHRQRGWNQFHDT